MEVLDLDSVDWKASRRDRNRGGPKWKMLTPMSTPRSSHTIEVLDGVIYVVGGGDGREWLCTAECYNPKTLRWSPIARYVNEYQRLILLFKGFRKVAFYDVNYSAKKPTFCTAKRETPFT